MSSLARATIATVGSGVMAEAIIAGLLRDRVVSPERIVASHPRADRREALERAHGIRTVDSNGAAVDFVVGPVDLGHDVGEELRLAGELGLQRPRLTLFREKRQVEELEASEILGVYSGDLELVQEGPDDVLR